MTASRNRSVSLRQLRPTFFCVTRKANNDAFTSRLNMTFAAKRWSWFT